MKEILDITKEKMGKCVNALESELATIRAGRANPSVLDRITVDYYGCPTPVNQMASISVSEARILVCSAVRRFYSEVHREGYPGE